MGNTRLYTNLILVALLSLRLLHIFLNLSVFSKTTEPVIMKIGPTFNDEDTLLEYRQQSLVKCLPECEHYDYPLEVALGNLAMNTPLSTLAFYNDMKLDNHSVVNVFFNDLVSTKYRRDVNLNWQNILDPSITIRKTITFNQKNIVASLDHNTVGLKYTFDWLFKLITALKTAFGGLLSLTLGFTLIAGFDFILFFVIRVVYDSFTGHFTEVTETRQDPYIINVKESRYQNQDDRDAKLYTEDFTKGYRTRRQ